MEKKVRSSTVVDGSEVQLRKLSDGRYRVEDGDGNQFEDPVESRQQAEEQFKNTVQFVNRGIRANPRNDY